VTLSPGAHPYISVLQPGPLFSNPRDCAVFYSQFSKDHFSRFPSLCSPDDFLFFTAPSIAVWAANFARTPQCPSSSNRSESMTCLRFPFFLSRQTFFLRLPFSRRALFQHLLFSWRSSDRSGGGSLLKPSPQSSASDPPTIA